MKNIFRNLERKTALLFAVFLACSLTVSAQSVALTGIVKDAFGEGIIGANVVEKGTTNGTVTDLDGNFSLTVSGQDAVLTISFLGYITQDIRVGNQSSFNVILKEDTQNLDEVIVIGYGTAKKSDLTGAVTRADMEALEKSPNVNVLQGLKGVVPGLNIGIATKAGDSPTVSIRGRNSISGSTEPLVVLDGVIYRGNISDINPSDIESIDVLKDASSTAIYGSQAANGVLMITTKTAKTVSKPIFEYSGTFYDSIHNTENGIKPTTYDILATIWKSEVGTLFEFCNEFGYNVHDKDSMDIYKAVLRESLAMNEMFEDCMDELYEIA